MPRGGYRPAAGRPRGAKTAGKKVAAAEKTLAAAGENTKRFKTALEFAMDTINDPQAPIDAKIRLAIAVMPFQHPKMESKAGSKKDEQAERAKKAAAGKFAPPSAPKLAVDNTR